MRCAWNADTVVSNSLLANLQLPPGPHARQAIRPTLQPGPVSCQWLRRWRSSSGCGTWPRRSCSPVLDRSGVSTAASGRAMTISTISSPSPSQRRQVKRVTMPTAPAGPAVAVGGGADRTIRRRRRWVTLIARLPSPAPHDAQHMIGTQGQPSAAVSGDDGTMIGALTRSPADVRGRMTEHAQAACRRRRAGTRRRRWSGFESPRERCADATKRRRGRCSDDVVEDGGSPSRGTRPRRGSPEVHLQAGPLPRQPVGDHVDADLRERSAPPSVSEPHAGEIGQQDGSGSRARPAGFMASRFGSRSARSADWGIIGRFQGLCRALHQGPSGPPGVTDAPIQRAVRARSGAKALRIRLPGSHQAKRQPIRVSCAPELDQTFRLQVLCQNRPTSCCQASWSAWSAPTAAASPTSWTRCAGCWASPKASELRGESMQDVIFNGSTSRKPASRASVELVSTTPTTAPAGREPVRRDRRQARAHARRHQQLLHQQPAGAPPRRAGRVFLGTGLGPRAYAIIGQGTISRIIESARGAAPVPRRGRRRLQVQGAAPRDRKPAEGHAREHDAVEDILRELDAATWTS